MDPEFKRPLQKRADLPLMLAKLIEYPPMGAVEVRVRRSYGF